MKKILLTVVVTLLFCSVFFGQRPAQNPMSKEKFAPLSNGYKLAWEDQFDGDRLDTSKWAVRGVGARALGFVSPEAVKIKDGYLTLSAIKKGDSILISAIGTQGRYMTKYGYFECRAQLQHSPGVWAAFWIQSTEISKGEDPAKFGAEIDIMECFKKLGKDIVSHNVHWAYGPHQKSTHGMQSYLKGVSKGFHIFGVEWFPDRYIFYVDGYKYYEVTQGISNIEEYIILSMEIAGEKKEIRKTIFPDKYVVDYVKVYKKK